MGLFSPPLCFSSAFGHLLSDCEESCRNRGRRLPVGPCTTERMTAEWEPRAWWLGHVGAICVKESWTRFLNLGDYPQMLKSAIFVHKAHTC